MSGLVFSLVRPFVAIADCSVFFTRPPHHFRVIADLQDLTAEKGNLFQIPPVSDRSSRYLSFTICAQPNSPILSFRFVQHMKYFAYIAKSFSVLEGIGLSNDPNYSIINEW